MKWNHFRKAQCGSKVKRPADAVAGSFTGFRRAERDLIIGGGLIRREPRHQQKQGFARQAPMIAARNQYWCLRRRATARLLLEIDEASLPAGSRTMKQSWPKLHVRGADGPGGRERRGGTATQMTLFSKGNGRQRIFFQFVEGDWGAESGERE
jgi:hypothetical protein